MPCYFDDQKTLWMDIYLQPRSKSNEVVDITDEHVKIKLTALPIGGRANIALREWLAKSFKVRKAQVQLVKGELSRHKTIKIEMPTILPEWLPKRARMKAE